MSRLPQLHKNLERQYAQLNNKEDHLITVEPSERERIKQQIDELWEQIRPIEKEYQRSLRLEMRSLTVMQEDAEVIVAELVEFTEDISNNSRLYPDEVINLLQKIQNTLDEQSKPAAGKLKLAIPLFLNILSYEAELDAGNILRQLFPTFGKLLKKN
jgi:polyhydroxyalkanoate synthesis regulator phasin